MKSYKIKLLIVTSALILTSCSTIPQRSAACDNSDGTALECKSLIKECDDSSFDACLALAKIYWRHGNQEEGDRFFRKAEIVSEYNQARGSAFVNALQSLSNAQSQ